MPREVDVDEDEVRKLVKRTTVVDHIVNIVVVVALFSLWIVSAAYIEKDIMAFDPGSRVDAARMVFPSCRPP